MGVHIKAYDKTGAAIDSLPDFINLTEQVSDDGTGMLTFDYLRDGVNASLLDMDELLLCVWENGVAHPDYFMLEDDTDDEAAAINRRRYLKVAARHYMGVLDQAVVYPAGHNTAGTNLYGLKPSHTFTDKSPGNIMAVLINEAKARGCFPELTYDFVTATDSNGVAWPKVYDITYPAGTNYLQILMDMVDAGWVDARMERRVLKLYVPDTYFGETGYMLRYGQNVRSAPRKRSRRDIFSHVLTAGDTEKKATVQVANTTTATRFGRREGYVADNRLTKTTALTTFGTRELAKHQQQREGFTLEMILDEFQSESWAKPGIDFKVGDRLYYDRYKKSATEFQPCVVRSISWTWGDTKSPPTCSIELNDLFLKRSIKQARTLASATGGNSNTTPPPVVVPAPDRIAPQGPATVTVTTTSTLVTENVLEPVWRARATITWDDSTLDGDGATLDDLYGYAVQVSINAGPWSASKMSTDTQDELNGLRPGDSVQARVLAQDLTGNQSSWTSSDTVTVPVDTVPPNVPTVPILTQKSGVVTCRWDGKGMPGNVAMPTDFHHVEVQRSLSSTFASGVLVVDNLYEPDATTLVTGQPYAETWYYRLIAVDVTGNRSAASATASIATEPLVTADLPQEVIDDLDQAIADAADANAAAAAAQSTANAAATQADFDTALADLDANYYTKTETNTQIAVTAATKNTVVYSTSDPSGTTYVNGDIWRKVDTLANGGKILGEWTFVVPGATWVTRAYSGAILTALDAGTISAGFLSAARIATDSLSIGQVGGLQKSIDLSASKVNNPSRSATTVGWQLAIGNPGAVVVEDKDFNGTTIKAFKVSSNGNTQLESDRFPIDVTKAYEVRFWVLDPTDQPGTSQFYAGLNEYDGALTAMTVGSAFQSTGALGTPTNNFYAQITTTNTPAWKEHVYYVMPSDATTADLTGLGVACSVNAIHAAAATQMKVRFLNWNNAGVSRDLWLAHITVRELGLTEIRAARTVESWRATGTTTINGGVIQTDSILATAIKANTIGAKQLLVGDMSNMVEIDETTAGLVAYGGATHAIETVSSVRWSKRDTTTASQFFMFRNQHGPLPFKQGDRIRLTFDAFADASVSCVPMLWAYGTTNPSFAFTVAPTPLGGSAYPTTITTTAQSFAWECAVGALTDQTAFLIGLSGLLNANVRVRNVRAYRMSAGELIVDGSIEGKQIKANSITADRIIASGLTITTSQVTNLDTTLAAKTRTFVQSSIPTSTAINDLWVNTTAGLGNRMYRAAIVGANEIAAGEWEVVSDPNSKTTTFAQTSIPVALAVGDLWVNTTAGQGNKMYRAASIGSDAILAGEWELVNDPTAKTTTFAQTGIPVSTAIGDLWVNTTAGQGNRIYRAASVGADAILAGEWVLISDPNAKTTTFAQTSVPVATAVGDLWVNTTVGQSNKMYRAASIGADAIAAGEWELVNDPALPEANAKQYADDTYGVTKTRVNSWTFSGQTTIDGGQIQTDTILAAAIKAHTIGADQLVIGGVTNLVPNGTGEWGVLGGIIAAGTSFTFSTTDKPTGLRGAFHSAPSAPTYSPANLWWDVEPESEFLFEVWLKADKPNSRMYIELRDQDGNHAAICSPITGEASAATGTNYPVNNFTLPTVWTRYTCKVVPIAGVTRMKVAALYFNHVNGTERTAVQSIALRIRGRGIGRLLVDGTIETKHMKANSITADLLDVGAVKAEKLDLGVLRSNLINDPGFEDTSTLTNFTDTGQGLTYQWRKVTSGTAPAVDRGVGKARTGARRLVLSVLPTGTTATIARAYSPTFKVEAGKTYRVNWYALANGTGATGANVPKLTVDAIFGPSVSTLSEASPTTVSDGVTNPPYVDDTTVTPDSYALDGGDLVIAGGATDLYCSIRFTSTNNVADTYIYLDDISVVEKGAGGASELTSAGLRLFDDGGDETTALVSNRPNYFTVSKDGDVVAGVSSDGFGSFTGLSVLTTGTDPNGIDDAPGLILPGGEDFADRMWRLPQGTVAQVYRRDALTIDRIRTEYGVYEVSWLHQPGRLYRLMFTGGTLTANTGAPTMTGIVRLRYTVAPAGTPSVAPTPTITANSQIARATFVPLPANGAPSPIPPLAMQQNLIGSSTIPLTVRMLLTVGTFNAGATDYVKLENWGGSSAPVPLECIVEDIGLDVPDTWQTSSAGGTLYTGGTDSTGGGTPTTQKKTYTTYWTASGSQTRRGTSSFGNNTVNPTTYTGSTKMLAGYYDSTNGNQHAYAEFANAATGGSEAGKLLTGGSSPAITASTTITKVEVYVKCVKTYSSSGGSQRFGMSSLTDISTASALTPSANSGYTGNIGFTEGQGKWVTLPAAAATTIKNGGRVVIIGPGTSTSKTYYTGWVNHTASGKPLLRVTYTK